MGKVKVLGVGINDANYPLSRKECYVDERTGARKRRNIWVCPFYAKWISMMKRGYCTNYQNRFPSYQDCTICAEWLTFSNFKAWMEKQDWQGNHLDKDLLVFGNKHYSQETCVFIPPQINYFINENTSKRGVYPVGVHWNSRDRKFAAQCKNPFNQRKENLGYYDNPMDAHEAWRLRKHELALLWAELIDNPLVKVALQNRYSISRMEWMK